jgi:DNA-binding XRE family transcriptional regulator
MDGRILRKCRQAAGLTTTEAGALVHVTRKTFESWERNDGLAGQVLGKIELFFIKLPKAAEENGYPTLLLRDGNDTVIDGIAKDMFYDLQIGIAVGVVKTMALRRENGRPYIHQTHFDLATNAGTLVLLKKWPKLKFV